MFNAMDLCSIWNSRYDLFLLFFPFHVCLSEKFITVEMHNAPKNCT